MRAFEFLNPERLLDLHAQYDIKASFAVVGAASFPGPRPYHDPHQIRRIHSPGHEIASHSLRHDSIPGLTHQELYETLRVSKDALEQCVEVSINTLCPHIISRLNIPGSLLPRSLKDGLEGKIISLYLSYVMRFVTQGIDLQEFHTTRCFNIC